MDRRRFLTALTLGTGAVLSALVAIPLVGQFLSPLRRRASGPATWLPLGRLDDFPEGAPQRVAFPVTTEDGWTETTTEQAAWVLRSGDEVTVLSGTCPHLGCSVRLAAGSKAFGCPCHESEFAPDGAYRRGPARRGLDPLPSRVVGGRVEVRFVEYQAGLAERRALGEG